MGCLVRIPLQLKFGFLMGAGLLLLLGLFGVLGTLMARNSADQMKGKRATIAQLTASTLDEELGEQFIALEAAARDPRAGSAEMLDAPVLQHAFSEPFVRSVFMADATGRVMWSSGTMTAGTDISSQSFFVQPMLLGGRYVTPAGGSDASGASGVALSVPVRDASGRPAGVMGVSIELSHEIHSLLTAAARQLGATAHAELVDQLGRTIMSALPDGERGPEVPATFYEPLLAKGSAAVAPAAGRFDATGKEQRHLVAFAPLVSVPWAISVGGPESEVTAAATSWRNGTALFAAIALLTTLFLMWVTRRTVVAPVRALIGASHGLGSGDLSTPIPESGGGEVRALSSAFESMRIRLQEALNALALAGSRHQGIIESMADGVIATDGECRILTLNPAAEQMTGWATDEVVGLPYCRLLQPPDATGDHMCLGVPGTCQPDASAPVGMSRATVRCRDGGLRLVVAAKSAMRGSDGSVQGLVYVLRDVTAAEEFNRLKEEFVSTVSHELRTPLGHIKGYALTLLSGERLKDEQLVRDCLGVIVDASDELQELVDNILDASQIEAGALAIHPEPVGLGAVVGSAIERLRPRAGGHRLVNHVPPALPLVQVDPHRLEQVLMNLMDNSIKYSPAGGDIVVGAEAGGTEVVFHVTDEGMGMPPEEARQVFERFRRGAAAQAAGIRGAGLGLDICRGIVEAHGGRIWAESPAHPTGRRAGPGTVVRVALPVASAFIAESVSDFSPRQFLSGVSS